MGRHSLFAGDHTTKQISAITMTRSLARIFEKKTISAVEAALVAIWHLACIWSEADPYPLLVELWGGEMRGGRCMEEDVMFL